MATYDFDFPPDLASWDFSIRWQGVTYPVKFPTAIQLSRLLGRKDKSREAATMAAIRLLHELTGIPLESCLVLQSDVVNEFIDRFGELAVNVLGTRTRARKAHNARMDSPESVPVVN